MSEIPQAWVEKAAQAAFRHVVEESGDDWEQAQAEVQGYVMEFYLAQARTVLAAVVDDIRRDERARVVSYLIEVDANARRIAREAGDPR